MPPIFVPVLPTDAEAVERSRYFKVSIIGKGGVGKTQLLTTLPVKWTDPKNGGAVCKPFADGAVWESDFYPLAVVDVDNKALTLPALLPFREARMIDVYPVHSPLVDSTDRRARAWQKAMAASIPAGYLECVDICNFVAGETREKERCPVRYKTICLDTFSRMLEHLQRVAEKIQGIPDMSGWHWRKYSGLIEEFISGFITKARNHVIVNCHILEKSVIKDDKEVIIWKPAIGGEKRDSYVAYFNEAYFMYAQGVSGGGIGHRLTARVSEKFPCRTSIIGLPEKWSASDRSVETRGSEGKAVTEADALGGLALPISLWRKQMEAKGIRVTQKV